MMKMAGLFRAAMFCTYVAVSCLLFYLPCNADLDEWQYIRRGKDIRRIAVNNKALYSLTESNSLAVLQSDFGFESFSTGVVSMDVFNNGMWAILNVKKAYYRKGMESGTMQGTSYVTTNGFLSHVAAGKRGLVMGYNSNGDLFIRTGITTTKPEGVGWSRPPKPGRVTKITCGYRICFYVANKVQLFTTGLLSDGNSPTVDKVIDMKENASHISAYGQKTFWKTDLTGSVWEAVNVRDPDFLKINWERRGYQATKFKSIAVTNKLAFAVSNDGRINVRTGCPIFDFEDDDISTWDQTGTAFAYQPVVGQLWSFGTTSMSVLGKVGDRFIDTASKRKSYSQSSSSSYLLKQYTTGTLTSPQFQIRSSYLHFLIGGGSYPNNYVALRIGGSNVRTSNGRSRPKDTPEGNAFMGRYWWDVSDKINKCAQIKLYDLDASSTWGFTNFDDLRASPSCFSGMKAILVHKSHDDVISVGKTITKTIELDGFSSTKLRMLSITVEFPAMQGHPLVYVERASVTWTHCKSSQTTKNKFSPKFAISKRPNKVDSEIINLFSDAKFEVVGRVYDHDALPSSGNELSARMRVTVNYANEFIKRMTRKLTVRRHDNETANLILEYSIVLPGNYAVGDIISLEVGLRHNYTLSLQRGYNINVKLNLPNYLTLHAIRGLNSSVGETHHLASSSEHVAVIPQLLLADNKTLFFDVRISGDARAMRKPGQVMTGGMVLDVTYCPRNNCRNHDGSGVKVNWLVKSKTFTFNFFNSKSETVPKPFTAIIDKTGSFVFMCGAYQSTTKPVCYFKKMTSIAWRSLGLMMMNISLYDPAEKVLYGEHHSGNFMKMYGVNFENKIVLAKEDWDSMLSTSTTFDKPFSVVTELNKSLRFDKSVSISTNSGRKFAISCDGIGTLLAGATSSKSLRSSPSWKPLLKWRCCY